MHARLDGELTVVTDDNPWGLPKGAKGVLECKTGKFRTFKDLDKWIEFPIHYYAQQCHQLAVTGWDFNLSASRIRRDAYRDSENGFPEIRTLYHMVKREHALDDIDDINYREEQFYKFLQSGIRPDFNFI